MTWRRALAALVAVAVSGCAQPITGTAIWPGAQLEKAVLTAADLPPGVQYERLDGGDAGQGGQRLPAMRSRPPGCSEGLTRVIEASAEPGPTAEYLVSYDGARMAMTVLTWPLDLGRLAAAADRCAEFEAYFDESSPGIPMTTTRLPTPRSDALVYEQTMQLQGARSSVYFSFENVGRMAVFGVAFPTPNPSIPVKGSLPQTFLDLAAMQADRARAAM